ncbi:MAG: hypothetical protein ACETWQ_06265 [Phycisphaerae bacterium]
MKRVLVQPGVLGFEDIQPVSGRLVKAEQVVAGSPGFAPTRAKTVGYDSCRAAAGPAPTSNFMNRGGVIMYCAGSRVLSNNLALCCAASYSYFSSINSFDIENNPEISRFSVAKLWYFSNFF